MGSGWTDGETLLEKIEEPERERGKKQAGGVSAEEEHLLEDLRRIADLAREMPDREVPSNFTSCVMDRIGQAERSRWRGFWAFLSRQRQIRLNLLHVFSGAGALALLILFLLPQGGPSIPEDAASLEGTRKEYVVRFSYNNPEARQVYVSGSFNNWRKDQSPLVDPSGRGLWTGTVVMKPGSYEYMFVVDGRWVTDEHALHYKDDGFGRKNALLNLGIGDERAI